MLAGILAKMKGGQYPAARLEIDHICLTHIGLSMSDVKQRSPESLTEHLSHSGPLKIQRSILLAELLLQDAELCDRDANETGAVLSRMHAFCLLTSSIDSLDQSEQPAYRAKLTQIAEQLKPFTTHPYLVDKLSRAS